MAVHLSYADNSAVLRRPGISERNSADVADYQKCSACKYHSAAVFYGSQRSADSAGNNARELVSRINDILSQTDCEKVNMIVHSKGGPDCKCTARLPDITGKVLNLTAANAPHKGRRIADYPPAKAPRRRKKAQFRLTIARHKSPRRHRSQLSYSYQRPCDFVKPGT